MPSDAVTVVVSTGIGISLVAGLLSGVFYILAHGFSKPRNSSKGSTQWHCTVCGNYLRSIEGVLEPDRVVTCSKCAKKVCKRRCAKYHPVVGRWLCQNCLKQPPWFQAILKAFRENSRKLLQRPTAQMDPCQINEDIELMRNKEKEQVRDFIERLVASMLGGNVDDASVARIYNDKSYDALFERYHQDLSTALIDLGSALHISISNLPVSGQSPCTAHATLKQIIERLLRESVDLPSLNRVEEHPATPAPETDRTYEDLLATAIINKVVNTCQNNLASSSAASVSSKLSSSSRNKNDKEYFFGEETLDTKWKNTDLDTTSVSSLEEWMHSDSSVGSTKYVDRLSLTIQQRIEESIQTESENEDEDSEYFRSNSSLLTNDEPNWYLQKRHFRASHSPVPVPMLVPNPTTEAKVLIGDKELDETSDLSDALSDDYGDTESVPDVKSLLVESKMLIGGKNITSNLHEGGQSDAESSADSGVKDDRGDLDEDKYYEAKPKSDITIDDENIEDASLLSVYSNTEKDTEYTEKYASLPRTILKSPIPPSMKTMKIELDLNSTTEESPGTTENPPETSEPNNIEDFAGSYSKKEKEKWNNPIEMAHNPYTKENIEKRMTTAKIFGRDYYARQASSPSGGKKVTEVVDNEQETLYRAVPTIIHHDEQEPEAEAGKEEHDYSEIASDSDLSLVNYYDVENSKIYHKGSDGDQKEIRVTLNTKGLWYKPTNPEEPVTNGVTETKAINGHDETVKSEIKITVNTNGLLYKNTDESREVEVPQVKPRLHIKQPPVPKKRTEIIDKSPVIVKSFDSFDTPPTVIQKKSDNTLIKKIYSDPTVRSFALINRPEYIPATFKEEPKPKPAEPKIEPAPETKIEVTTIKIESLIRQPSTPDPIYGKNNTLPRNFSLESSDTEPVQRQGSPKTDPEISQLKQKRLVANRLGEFSRSFPNLTRILSDSNSNLYKPMEASSFADLSEEGLDEGFTSVKDLKRRFESNDALAQKSKPVHSLTARSISKPMRDSLRNQDSIESAHEDVHRGEIEEIHLNAENAIKFYEMLGK